MCTGGPGRTPGAARGIVYDNVQTCRIKQEYFMRMARTMHNIAVVQTKARRYKEAEATFEQALPRMKAAQGRDHPEVAQALASWGKLKKDEKDFPAAEGLYRESLELRLQKAGEESPAMAKARLRCCSYITAIGGSAAAGASIHLQRAAPAPDLCHQRGERPGRSPGPSRAMN